ncbi:centrosomal protein of 68 kDa isoform X2 [Cottoperca gobio]|uniref:Centrosomal protein of 68 kDa isoform X2 n=1 Tax=Cottoperca gobio TaxID=56716 RepID=A0A6J2R7R8_COTGO|nr:centrosomal protein of 68 kDa isoform X2 [Cottoperca gobio]
MEAEGCIQRWKMHLPEFKQSRKCSIPTARDKSVTLAPTCRYLTDRQYVMRTPLFSAEQHPSILKKHTEKEKQLDVSRREEKQQHTDITFLSRAREELSPESFSLSHSDMSLPSELRARLSLFPGSRSAQRSLLSSNLEVQRLNPPVRLQLTSTVLYPTYSPRSGNSKGRGGGETKLCSSGGHSRHPTSPYQANYWACAIPKALPPSPDRQFAVWDHNREYQVLLDYSYPLKARQLLCEGDSLELRGHSLNLQDSGIELDHLCSSGSLSPDLQGLRSSETLLSLADPVALDCSHHRHHAQSRCVCGELDEDLWPLPEQLEELQLLSRQVRKVTAQLSWPITASRESLQPGTRSILSSVTLPEKQEADQDTHEGKEETGREEWRAAHTADHRDSAAVRRSSGAWVEPAGGGGGLSPSRVRGVEVLVCGLNLTSSQEQREHSDSLMQHIQVFCLQLEQLIQQLRAVSEKMEVLAAPTVDIDSVKSSLAEYQSFQRAMSIQQPLTSRVLHSGQLLLSCINTMSPLLRDTLQLIERQCGVLESHSQHHLCSILSAMDSLSLQNQQSREEPLASTLS